MRADNHGEHYSKASISRMMDDMRKDAGEWGASQAQLRAVWLGPLLPIMKEISRNGTHIDKKCGPEDVRTQKPVYLSKS